jgi:hypothetical protein
MSAFPIRLGTPDDFARLRDYFRDVAFDADTIYGVLPFDQDGKLDTAQWERRKADVAPARRFAIEVFFRGGSVPEGEFRATCSAETWRTLCALGLLRSSTAQPGELVSPVWIYPLDGLLVVSDRFEDADGGAFVPPDDVVFSALNHLTMRFLHILPSARGGDALDLCGGCGVGALRLAQTARSAASADLTARSAFFTGFNAKLNGIEIESLRGDLYQPAGERQFDLITAHPPFIPVIGKPRMIYRDAGDFGEQLARRIVEGLPERLRAGGSALIVFAGWDTATPLELRAREWLGGAATEFDIVLGEYTRTSIEGVIDGLRSIQREATGDELRAFEQGLRAWGAQRRTYGALAFRRSAVPVTQPPLRLQMKEETPGATFQRVLDWREARRNDGLSALVAQIKPRPAPHLELIARHTVQDGGLAVADYLFQSGEEIMGKLRLDPWVAPLIARFDGRQSVAQVFAAAQASGALPQGFTLDDFAGLVALMAERGFLDADPPPPSN